MLTHLDFFLFCMHYTPNFVDLATRVDRSMYLFCSIVFIVMLNNNGKIIFSRTNHVFRINTPGVGQQLLIQNGPLSCRLVLLSTTYMENCVIISANISSLPDHCIGYLKVTGKRMSPILDPSFANLVQRSNSGEEPILIRWLSGGRILH